MGDETIERAAELLRNARPEVGDDDALVRHALLAGRTRHRNRGRRARVIGVGALLAACLAGGVLWFGGHRIGAGSGPNSGMVARTPAPTAAPSEATSTQRLREPRSPVLRRGDRLLTTEPTRFELEPAVDGHRVVHLRSGAMLFDLAPLEEGESFEVRTQHLSAHVVGTIFSVEAGDWSAVEVFEGEVEVRDGSGARRLGPGERFGPPGTGLRSLRSAGLEAARSRSGGDPPTQPPPVITPLRSSARPARRSPEPVAAAGPDEVRRWILSGRADEALRVSRRHPSEPHWRFVEGDALRALSRPTEAAARYDAAARGLPVAERREAAYLAARLHLAMSAPDRALTSLALGGVTDPGSPLRERGLALRGDAPHRLSRTGELREVAREYRREFPTGGRAAWMGRVLDAPSETR